MQSLSRRERAEIDWAFLAAVHDIEPELRAPVPRRVRSRSAGRDWLGRLSRWVLAGALWGTLALGAVLLLYAGFAALIFPLGATTTATVTAHQKLRASDSNFNSDSSLVLRFKFAPPGDAKLYRGSWPADAKTAIPVGATAPVRYFPFAPGALPILQSGDAPWGHIIVMAMMGLIMLFIGGVPLRAFFSGAGKELVRRGAPTLGVVVARQGDCATIWFRVANERGQGTIEFSQVLSATAWTRLAVGAPLTVLYDPRRPQRALVYADADFAARA